MSQKTCRHCAIIFSRPDDCPIPADCCERCHEKFKFFVGLSTSALQYDPESVAPKSLPKQARYQDAKGEDWIDEFARTATPEEFRGAMKFDANKPRMDLLIQGMPRALEEVGRVLTFGAQKYAAHSWKHVEDNQNRYWAAKVRHELARAKGEERDPETGLLHLAHEACNALFLLELALLELEQ